jgi:hypothetical protein
MTRFTPLWQQAGSYSAQVDRELLAALWPTGGASGAVPTTVANTMNVSIPAGFAAVPLVAGQNTALCRWDAAEVVTSPAAPPAGNTRIDVVVCQVRDPQLDAGVNNDFLFLVVSGANSTGTPVAPAVPANALAVCQYTVPAAAANLNGVTITDRRPSFAPLPSLLTATGLTGYSIQAGMFTSTSDASGNAVLTFPVAFRAGTVPVLLVSNPLAGAAAGVIFSTGTTTNASAYIHLQAGNSNTPVGSFGFTVAWIAFGVAA